MMLLRQSTHRMVMQYHPHIGYRYVPNVQARILNESGGYFIRTNSQGFRSNVEFSTERKARPRILVFGDSYTAGDGCDNEQRFTDRLGEALDAEVYNFGMSGSGTDQQLLISKNSPVGRRQTWFCSVLPLKIFSVSRQAIVNRLIGYRASGYSSQSLILRSMNRSFGFTMSRCRYTVRISRAMSPQAPTGMAAWHGATALLSGIAGRRSSKESVITSNHGS